MNYLQEKLNNEVSERGIDEFGNFKGYANGILRVAWLLLEELSPLPSLWRLAIYSAADALEKTSKVGDAECVEYSAQLVERLLEIAEEQALELPDIDSDQYDHKEVRAQQLELAFDILTDADLDPGTASDALEIQDLAIKLALEMDERDQADKRDLEALKRMDSRYADWSY